MITVTLRVLLKILQSINTFKQPLLLMNRWYIYIQWLQKVCVRSQLSYSFLYISFRISPIRLKFLHVILLTLGSYQPKFEDNWARGSLYFSKQSTSVKFLRQKSMRTITNFLILLSDWPVFFHADDCVWPSRQQRYDWHWFYKHFTWFEVQIVQSFFDHRR